MFKKIINKLNLKKENESYESATRDFLRIIKENGIAEKYPTEAQFFENLISAQAKDIESLIVPRNDIVAVEANTEIDKIVNIVVKTGFSRIPVYKESLENIIGFIHAKDVLYYYRQEEDFNIEKITRDILFINPYMKILNAISYLRNSKAHIAIVLDEFGSVSGLVTLEEMIEEITGDIQDEHDHNLKSLITQISDGIANLEGKTPLEDLEKITGYTFAEKEEVNTVSGLILYMAGGVIPKRNEVIKHSSGMLFTILASDRNKINSIKVDFRKLNI